jgi:hypothetical protein
MSKKKITTERDRIVNMIHTLRLVHVEGVRRADVDLGIIAPKPGERARITEGSTLTRAAHHGGAAAALDALAKMIGDGADRHAMFDDPPTLEDVDPEFLERLLAEVDA